MDSSSVLSPTHKAFVLGHGLVNNLLPEIKWFRTSNCQISWLKWYSVKADPSSHLCQTKSRRAKWPSKIAKHQVLVGFLANSKWFVRGPTWTLCNGEALDWLLSATSSNLLIGWGSKYWNMLDHMQVAKQQLHLWNHERQSACANRRRMHWIHLTHLLMGRLCCSTFSTTFSLCYMLSHMRLVFFSCWLVTVVNDRCDPWNQLMKSALWCATNGEVRPLQIQG